MLYTGASSLPTWCYTPVPPLTSVLHFVIRHFCLDHLGLKSPTSSPVRVPNLCQSVSRRVLLHPLPLDLRSRNFTLLCSLTSVLHFVIQHFCLDHLGFEVAHFFACQSAEPLSVRLLPHKCLHFVIRHFCLDHLIFEVAHFFACQSAEPLSVCFTSHTSVPITSGPEIA